MLLAIQDVQYNQTSLHPLGLLATVVLGVAVLLVPRRYSGLPVLAMACLVAPGQRLVLLGFDFNLLRLILLFGLTRVIVRGEYNGFTWKRLDSAVLAWSAISAVIFIALRGDQQAVVTKMGRVYDSLGMYLFFRCSVRGWADLDRTIKSILLLTLPVALAFMIEKATRHNPFSILGGVPVVTIMREGRLRCQGPFPHAILAGCFWAALLPLLVARWWRGASSRLPTLVGSAAVLLIIILCASSTPLGGVAAGITGAAAYFLRRNMQVVRWAILLTLVSLHMVMEAPVWHLISRIDLAGGSTGWHRYSLIQATIDHFDEWWFLGIESTRHWGRGLGDVTNQFILEGVRGGILSLLLFILIIALAFDGVGRAWRRYGADPYKMAICWALGVSILIHIMMFLAIAISYAHQNLIAWYFVLASIAGITPTEPGAQRARVGEVLPVAQGTKP